MRSAVDEGCTSKPRPTRVAVIARRAGAGALGQGEVVRPGDLDVAGQPRDQAHLHAETLDQRRVVGLDDALAAARRWASRRTSARKACGVWTLHNPPRSTVA
jgi:hypothetical protein